MSKQKRYLKNHNNVYVDKKTSQLLLVEATVALLGQQKLKKLEDFNKFMAHSLIHKLTKRNGKIINVFCMVDRFRLGHTDIYYREVKHVYEYLEFPDCFSLCTIKETNLKRMFFTIRCQRMEDSDSLKNAISHAMHDPNFLLKDKKPVRAFPSILNKKPVNYTACHYERSPSPIVTTSKVSDDYSQVVSHTCHVCSRSPSPQKYTTLQSRQFVEQSHSTCPHVVQISPQYNSKRSSSVVIERQYYSPNLTRSNSIRTSENYRKSYQSDRLSDNGYNSNKSVYMYVSRPNNYNQVTNSSPTYMHCHTCNH